MGPYPSFAQSLQRDGLLGGDASRLRTRRASDILSPRLTDRHEARPPSDPSGIQALPGTVAPRRIARARSGLALRHTRCDSIGRRTSAKEDDMKILVGVDDSPCSAAALQLVG